MHDDVAVTDDGRVVQPVGAQPQAHVVAGGQRKSGGGRERQGALGLGDPQRHAVAHVEQRPGVVVADRGHPADAGHPQQQGQRQRRLVE